jgi:hypothetical protein
LILYKYYDYNAGLAALQSSQLGFRNPKDFNDPFELTFLSNAQGPMSKRRRLVYDLQELRHYPAILSLTRTPLNPLMWAHYGKAHEGFVIGYETNDKFLTSKDYNLITVDDGDVVYTNTKSSHILNRDSMNLLQDIINVAGQGLPESNDAKRAQRENIKKKVFLTKHSIWFYEEEVRVVKPYCPIESMLSDPLKHWYPLESVKGLRIYTNQARIKEVYLGIRNPMLDIRERDDRTSPPDKVLIDKANKEKWKVFALKMSQNSWELKSEKVPTDILAIRKRFKDLINGGIPF